MEGGQKVLQHRFYEQPECGVLVIPDSESWKSPNQNNIGVIELSFVDIQDESIKRCIRKAAQYWGGVINNQVPIHIQVAILPELQDELAICDVVFFEDTATTMLPSALYVQALGVENSQDSPDACIWLNPAKQWDTSVDSNLLNGGNSLYACALRSMAVCLGFGSSITSIDGITPCFQWDGHLSKFDELIIDSNGKKLSDCMTDDNALKSFITPDGERAIYVGIQSPEYKMYAPKSYRVRESLVYLDNPKSLMHYGLGTGDRNFNIDNVTALLMSKVGWNVPLSLDGHITCDNIDAAGNGVVWAPHRFNFTTTAGVDVEEYAWEFRLFTEDGTPITFATSSKEIFEVRMITDVSGYQILPDGDLRAEVRLSVTIQNQEYEVKPFSLKLSQRPYFSRIAFIGSNPYEDGYCDLIFGVDCFGTSAFSVNVMESMNPSYYVIEVDMEGNSHVHVIVSHFDPSNIFELEFIATNAYGTTVQRSRGIPKYMAILDDYFGCNIGTAKPIEKPDPLYYQCILVYDINSNLITKGFSYDELVSSLPPGNYFFHYYKNGELVKMGQVVIQ